MRHRYANTEHIAWLWATLIGVVIGMCVAAGVLLGRIDRATADASSARARGNAVAADLAAMTQRASTLISETRADVALCHQRTESLRGVLDILIPSGIWPDRVVLPDPPPGWAPWPAGNKYGHEPN